MYALACPSYQVDADDYQTSKPFSLKELIGDGMLWAVPKTRRTLERRQKRKFAYKELNKNWVLPQANFAICQQCGGDYQIGHLCGMFDNVFLKIHSSHLNLIDCSSIFIIIFFSATCYKRVIEETRAMQKSIIEKLGLDPFDKEVIVLYDGEKDKVCLIHFVVCSNGVC